MKEIKSKIGTMYFEIVEDKFKLYDSEQEYIGYVELASGLFDEKDIELLKEDLTEMEYISDIVDLGFCYNIIWGSSKKEVIQHLATFKENDEDFNAEDYEDLDINRVGNKYFLVDFGEYLWPIKRRSNIWNNI